jgi:hypothetical protein
MKKVIDGMLFLVASIASPLVASAQSVLPEPAGRAERWVALQVGVREQRGPQQGPVSKTEKQLLFAALAQVWGSASGGMLVLGEVWALQRGCIAGGPAWMDRRSCSSTGGHVAAGAQRRLGSGRSGLTPFLTGFVGASHAVNDHTHASFGVGTALVRRRIKGWGFRADLRFTSVPSAYYRTNLIFAIGLLSP